MSEAAAVPPVALPSDVPPVSSPKRGDDLEVGVGDVLAVAKPRLGHGIKQWMQDTLGGTEQVVLDLRHYGTTPKVVLFDPAAGRYTELSTTYLWRLDVEVVGSVAD